MIICDDNSEYRADIPVEEITDYGTYILAINAQWYPHFLGAINQILVNDDCYWNGTEDDILDVQNKITKYLSEVVMGSIMPLWTVYANFALSSAIPIGHEICNGLSYPASQYPLAYLHAHPSLKDETAETITVPNLSTRVLRGLDLTFPLSSTGGSDTHTLTVAELPDHNHSEITAVATAIAIGLGVPAPSAIPGTGNTGNTGSGSAIDIKPKFVATRYRVVLQ